MRSRFTRRNTLSTSLRGLLAVCALIFPLSPHAAPATLASDAELRADRYVDAAALKSVQKGTRVDTLKSEAGWVQVRAGETVGWLRASLLSGASAVVASVAQVEGGRSAAGNSMATSGIRTLKRPYRHALIIAVNPQSDPALSMQKGIKYDIDSATGLAESMSIPKEFTQSVDDLGAGTERIELEFDELEKRIHAGDRVFVYFWGAGSRWHEGVAKPAGCVEASLPAADALPLANQQMAALFQPISDKADKLFVFYCPRQ